MLAPAQVSSISAHRHTLLLIIDLRWLDTLLELNQTRSNSKKRDQDAVHLG